MQLNDEQRKLAEDNHNLIYSILQKYKLGYDDVEDWYGIAAEGLCKAAATYDPSSGNTFSTYAYTVMGNDIKCMFRHKYSRETVSVNNANSDNKRVYPVVYSLSESITDDGNCVLDDVIGSDSFVENLEYWDIIECVLKKMSPKCKYIIKMLIDGYKQSEAAKKIGCSRAYVNSVWIDFVTKCRKANEEADMV